MCVSEPLVHLRVARSSREQGAIKRGLVDVQVREDSQTETKQQ